MILIESGPMLSTIFAGSFPRRPPVVKLEGTSESGPEISAVDAMIEECRRIIEEHGEEAGREFLQRVAE